MAYIYKELVLLLLPSAVKVSKVEQRKVVVGVRLVLLHPLPYTLTDALGAERDALVLQPWVLFRITRFCSRQGQFYGVHK